MKFLIGLILGIAIAAGVAFYFNKAQNPFVDKGLNLSESTPSDRLKNSSAPIILAPGTKMEIASSAPTVNKEQASTPNYDFYDVLKGKKNINSDNNASTPTTAIKKPIASKPTQNNNSSYLIQVGAFSNADLANDMQAKLALMGVTAKIIQKPENGKMINKVIIGPVNDKSQAKSILSQLQEQSINATVININN